MLLTFLGTGTSTGVPQIGCGCAVCRSNDLRDKRLRTSALVQISGKNFLIDCGPDFRAQILACGSPQLEALLVTHQHYDHLGGLDDLRPYCYRDGGFPIYCRPEVARDIRQRMPYCFGSHPYPGSPRFNIHEIDRTPFQLGSLGLDVIPIPVMHTNNLQITGFRIGDLSYVTDCLTMPDSSKRLISRSEVLVVNALRHKEHRSHMSLQQALALIEEVKPRLALLTHISHELGLHSDIEASLPAGVRLAFDGLTVRL